MSKNTILSNSQSITEFSSNSVPEGVIREIFVSMSFLDSILNFSTVGATFIKFEGLESKFVSTKE